MNNPGHKQKPDEEPDGAPDWYYQAIEDALIYGTGWVIFRNGQAPENLKPEQYLEAAEALKWAYNNLIKHD
jgi:hypothetical protein